MKMRKNMKMKNKIMAIMEEKKKDNIMKRKDNIMKKEKRNKNILKF